MHFLKPSDKRNTRGPKGFDLPGLRHGAGSAAEATPFMLNHCRRKFPKVFVLGLLLLFLAAGFGFAAGQEEFPGESAKWSRYESPHFELFSAMPDRKSRELLHQLELLRALFFETFQQKERQPLPVTVYYFADRQAFKAYAPESQRQTVGGYYLDRPDRAVIALSPVWSDESARHIVFHEYIHHLNRAIGSTPPLWYNEGVAELFSTIEFKKDVAVLGKHLPWHVDSLREKKLFPLETLFAVGTDSPIYNRGRHSGRFYAESWALLHYWRYGESNLDPAKIERLQNYFRNESPDADESVRRQVFKDTIGIDYPEMEKRLAEYAKKGTFYCYQAKLPQIPDMRSYGQRAMPRDEIGLRLAELSLRVNQSANARLRLLEAAGKDPANARYWEVLGSDAWVGGDAEVAQERWQRALEAGSDNPAVFHELGQMEGRRWFADFDYNFRLPSGRAQQLRALLQRSIACVPEQNDAYEMLAWVEASVNKPDDANLKLIEQRGKTQRHKPRTVLALALVRVRMNERETAVTLLDQLDRMNPEYWVANAAETVRSKLEDRAPRTISPPPVARPKTHRLRPDLPELPR